ncbi:hypothetical protein COB52_02850 [Candidatus Kaiserbacteria bacterium]|nr:MAG: hypothetical protein COB52_02850 [Candidatus Kaiserbacteria bacterium]
MKLQQANMQLEIVTVSKELFNGEADELHCLGEDGQLTVLSNHEPLVTTLKESTLRVAFNGDEEKEFKILNGVLEVAYNRAVVLCSSNEL